MSRNTSELYTRYHDLLVAEDDLAMLRLVRDLDTVCGRPELPPSLARVPRRRFDDPPRPRRSVTRPRVLLAVAALFILLSGVAAAAVAVTNLGKPATTGLPDPTFPLGAFHHVGSPLRLHGRTELLFIGTQYDAFSGMERWPVVKALDQFGVLSNVRPQITPCPVTNQSPCLVGGYPTFNWAHATYRSRYVAFVHKDVLDANGHPLQSLSKSLKRLLRRYGPYTAPNKPMNFDPCNPVTTHSYPIVLIDGFLQTLSRQVKCGDFVTQQTVGTGPNAGTVNVPLSFDAVQGRMVSGVNTPEQSTARDINGDANIMTALICHADGGKPARVCTRPAIKAIVKHIK